MRLPGFEPELQAWEAWVLTSLDHSRRLFEGGTPIFHVERMIETPYDLLSIRISI